jgi:outer membrane lipoprotein-sorting protein
MLSCKVRNCHHECKEKELDKGVEDSMMKHMIRLIVPGFILAGCLSGYAAEKTDAGASGQDATAEAVARNFVKDGKLDLDAVVKHYEDLYRADSSRGEAELIVVRPRRTQIMTMKIWSKGEEKALVVIASPPREKGMATLKVDDNLWNYMPKIRRTIRIPPSMMQASWMGSDFTNDDLVRESSYSDDYNYELAGKSEDPGGWKIIFRAKPDLAGLWNRIELFVTEDGALPLEARYFDRKDRLARTMYFDEVKVFDGRRIPAHMKLIPEDEDKQGERTEMRYLDLEFNVSIPDNIFSLSNLEKNR